MAKKRVRRTPSDDDYGDDDRAKENNPKGESKARKSRSRTRSKSVDGPRSESDEGESRPKRSRSRSRDDGDGDGESRPRSRSRSRDEDDGESRSRSRSRDDGDSDGDSRSRRSNSDDDSRSSGRGRSSNRDRDDNDSYASRDNGGRDRDRDRDRDDNRRDDSRRDDGEREGGGRSNNNRGRSNNRRGGGRSSGRNSGGGNNNSRGRGRNNNRRRRNSGGNNGGGNNGYRGNNSNRNNSRGRNRNPEDNYDPADFDEKDLTEGVGLLELHPNGYGFLRSAENNFNRERSDPFVPGTMIEKFGLRPGVMITGKVQPGRRQQGPRLRQITDVDGIAPEEYAEIPRFEDKTPINPEYWYHLETGPRPITTRVMDMLTPLGKGQRALLVAPPRSGKTFMLQDIANGISVNHPDRKLIVLLIDERPEEVTDMRRNIKGGEVIASSLDEDVESHVRISQLVIERCRRLAELGQDVFLLMDSITRLARAFNKWVGNTGRTMSGGVDIKAMDIPKKLFATARSFEEGGSLTIVGTALVDTGSRMDELIFQEFKGTGNMELVLDRKLADRRIWPAMDITQSGTRREELLLDPDALHAITMLRRTLTSMHHIEAMEQLTRQLEKHKTNAEFIQLISGKMVHD